MNNMQQFDIVQIKRTDKIRFMSGPKGYSPDPHGNWIIIGFRGNNVLLSKNETVVLVPRVDVRKIGAYDTQVVFDRLKDVGNKNLIDMAQYLIDEHKWLPEKAKKLLKKYNFPSKAQNTEHRNRIVEQLERIVDENGDDPWE